ncbi:probable galacturonosyltransferase 9 [Tanacetum coccineum]
MQLIGERIEHPEKYRDDEPKLEFEDPKLYHYAIFSDNVNAVSVVVNSTVTNAKEQRKHVFHIITDKMNLAAMKVWFKIVRFYLPEMYLKLHRILFLDDDAVVQKDLTAPWKVDMDGNSIFELFTPSNSG